LKEKWWDNIGENQDVVCQNFADLFWKFLFQNEVITAKMNLFSSKVRCRS
jgi:hypothetical protein